MHPPEPARGTYARCSYSPAAPSGLDPEFAQLVGDVGVRMLEHLGDHIARQDQVTFPARARFVSLVSDAYVGEHDARIILRVLLLAWLGERVVPPFGQGALGGKQCRDPLRFRSVHVGNSLCSRPSRRRPARFLPTRTTATSRISL